MSVSVAELGVLSGIRRANYHRPGIKCRRVLALEDHVLAALRAEVIRLCREEQSSDVTDPSHATHWTGPFGEVRQLSLWNGSGRFDDYSEDHDGFRSGKKFHHGSRYPALHSLATGIPDLLNSRIVCLGPGAGIPAHEEQSVAREGSTVYIKARFHLPIQTNPQAELVLDGDAYWLEPGFVYFVNHGCVHSVVNHGSYPRIHLIWDCAVSRRCAALFFGVGPFSGLEGFMPVPTGQQEVPGIGRRAIHMPNRIAEAVSEADAANLSFAPG